MQTLEEDPPASRPVLVVGRRATSRRGRRRGGSSLTEGAATLAALDRVGGRGALARRIADRNTAEESSKERTARTTSIQVGASPDAVIAVYSDATVEVLLSSSRSRRSGRNQPRGTTGLALRDRGPRDALALWVVPQVMLEIHCAGPACSGARVASVSATRGATLFAVSRDDRYVVGVLALADRAARRLRRPAVRALPRAHAPDRRAAKPVRVSRVQCPDDGSTFLLDDAGAPPGGADEPR